MIELRALGTLVLRDSSGEDIPSVLAQPKRVALLAYLAVARPLGFHRRDTLLALLWPEQDEQHARWALNQALRHLRGALGKQVVVSRGDGEVGVDSQWLSCDVVQFETDIQQGDQAHALGLYHGDFLEGFHVAGCSDFERWLEEERVWLRRRAARAASALAQLTVKEPLAAGHWARQALALSPDDEGEARRLIELLDRMGDRAGAVQAYEGFAQRLRDEYEVEPAPETKALIEAVRSRQHARAGSNHERIETVAPGVQILPLMGEPQEAAGFRELRDDGRNGRRRRRMSLALGSLLLAAVGSVVWAPPHLRSTSDTGVAASNTIAVLPFGYEGGSSLAYLGEGMVDLLSANLNGAGDIRTVDPQTVLALSRRARDQTSGPEPARQVVGQLSASSFVLGEVLEAGGRLRISARLYSVDHREQPTAAAAVQGTPKQLFELVDELTARLIAGRNGAPAARLVRLAALTTDSLAALKAYLEGERYFREGRPDGGVLALERAVQIDSSFALAHYRLATMAMWSDQHQLALRSADRALRFSHRLGERDRRLIGALAASLRGRYAEAERTYRQLLGRNPNDVEANYQLGDLIFHQHALLHRSWLDARRPLERVLSIDPIHQSALYHLSSIAARERRLKELDSLTARVLKIVPPPGWFFRGQRAVAFGDTAEIQRFMTALRDMNEEVAQPTAGFVVFTTGDLDAGRRIWRLLTERSRSAGIRVLAHATLAKIEVMTGRWRAAKAELDSAGELDPATALEHRALLSLWPLLNVSRPELLELRDSLLQWKPSRGGSNATGLTAAHGRAHPYLRLYLLGLLESRLGDDTAAVRYAAELERQASISFAPSFVSAWARTVRAEVARARNRPAEALALLDSVGLRTQDELDLAGMSPFYAQEYQQFARAEVLYTLGRHEDALEAYRALADELFHAGGPAHLRLAQLYEEKGDRRMAAEHYAHFVELWKDCDPGSRPMVNEARRRMASMST